MTRYNPGPWCWRFHDLCGASLAIGHGTMDRDNDSVQYITSLVHRHR